MSGSPLKYSSSMKSKVERFDNRFTAQPPVETAKMKNSHLGPGCYNTRAEPDEPVSKRASPTSSVARGSWAFRSASARFAPEDKFKQSLSQIGTHFGPDKDQRSWMRKTYTFAKTERFRNKSPKAGTTPRSPPSPCRRSPSRDKAEPADGSPRREDNFTMSTDLPQRYSGAFRSKVDRFDLRHAASPVPYTHRLESVGPATYRPDKADEHITGSGKSKAAAVSVFKSSTPKLTYANQKSSSRLPASIAGLNQSASGLDSPSRDSKEWTSSGFAWSTSMRFKYDMY